jgi:hypothetical protein
MKKFLFYSIFIIFIFNCANIFNLFSQEPEGMDFLDQLLKEIETMEKSPDESKAPKFDEEMSTPVKSEPSPRYSDIFSEKEEALPQPRAQVESKDLRTLFLDPDVQQVKGSGKNVKTRPTKESVNALKHFSDEFNITAYSVENKISTNQDLAPQFKETKFIEFKKELERANSMMDIINDKGIYRALFLKPEKGAGAEKERSTQAATKSLQNVRQNFLDILKKLQNLDEQLGEPKEGEEFGVAALQKIAGQKPARALPKYQPLSAKKKPVATEKKPESAPKPKTTPEKIEPQDEDDESEGE